MENEEDEVESKEKGSSLDEGSALAPKIVRIWGWDRELGT